MPGAVSAISAALSPAGLPASSPAAAPPEPITRPEFAEGEKPSRDKIGLYQRYLVEKTKDFPAAGGAENLTATPPPPSVITRPPTLPDDPDTIKLSTTQEATGPIREVKELLPPMPLTKSEQALASAVTSGKPLGRRRRLGNRSAVSTTALMTGRRRGPAIRSDEH